MYPLMILAHGSEIQTLRDFPPFPFMMSTWAPPPFLKWIFLILRLQVSWQRIPAPYIVDKRTLSRLPISVRSFGIAIRIWTSSKVKTGMMFAGVFFRGIFPSVFLKKVASRLIFMAYLEKEFSAASLWFLVLALHLRSS